MSDQNQAIKYEIDNSLLVDCCATCYYSRLSDSDLLGREEVLRCHRYPKARGWPVVNGSSWCGEYEVDNEIEKYRSLAAHHKINYNATQVIMPPPDIKRKRMDHIRRL